MSLRAVTFVLVAAVGVFAAAGCQTSVSDIGTGPCFLVKHPADGGDPDHPPHVMNSDLTPGQDFISFDSIDCDNLICVHDKDMPIGDPTKPAVGYCSDACVPGSRADCQTTPAAAQFDPRPISCRAILLDATTIEAFCNSNPSQCSSIFGSNRTPYYCARGDAGT